MTRCSVQVSNTAVHNLLTLSIMCSDQICNKDAYKHGTSVYEGADSAGRPDSDVRDSFLQLLHLLLHLSGEKQQSDLMSPVHKR